MTTASVRNGQLVLVVPQAWAHLMNHHDDRNVIGQAPTCRGLTEIAEGVGPYWTLYRHGLLRLGYGLMYVTNDQLVAGPSHWDSGD